jgi:6-phosphogluconolactonase
VTRVFATTNALHEAAAQAFVEAALEAVERHDRFVAALTGGDTAAVLYERIAQPRFRDRIPWQHVHLFWGDERAVGPDHADSNYALARRTLLSFVPVDASRIHRMEGERADLEAAANDYAAAVAALLADGDGPPVFDLIHLGLGADAHTASLFPYSAELNERNRRVVATDGPRNGHRRLTFTFPLINAATALHLVVTGERKAAAVRAVLAGASDPDRYPAQRLAPVSGTLTWFLDAAAAGSL